jgi:hypothetical protein
MPYIRLCPSTPSIWIIRQGMMDLYQQYEESSRITELLRRQYNKKKREFEEMEIKRVIHSGEVIVKKSPGPAKEVKLTMEQVRRIAEKLGVSIDF